MIRLLHCAALDLGPFISMDFGNRHHPKVKRSLSCRAHRLISTRREDTAKNDATAEATSPRRKTKNDKSEDDIASPNSSGNDDAFKKRKAKEVVLPPTTTSDVADNGTQEIKVVNSVSSSVEDGIVVEDGTKRKRRKKRRSAPAEEDSCTVQGVEGLGTKVKAAKLVTLGRGVSIRDTQVNQPFMMLVCIETCSEKARPTTSSHKQPVCINPAEGVELLCESGMTQLYHLLQYLELYRGP